MENKEPERNDEVAEQTALHISYLTDRIMELEILVAIGNERWIKTVNELTDTQVQLKKREMKNGN